MYSHLLDHNYHTGRVSVDHGKTTSLESLSEIVCCACGAPHQLTGYSTFLRMSSSNGWKLMARSKLCFSCLSSGHPAAVCRNKVKCAANEYRETYQKLLHNDGGESSHTTVNGSSRWRKPSVNRVRLGEVPVRVIGSSGARATYALPDSGSNSSLVDTDIAKLGYKPSSVSAYSEISKRSENPIYRARGILYRVPQLFGTDTG